MLSDIFGQAIEAMQHNGRRTMITVVGMAWGIATVVLLLAYGAGFGQAFETIFAQWGTNMIGVFPGRTSEQAGGDKAGVQVRLTQEDVERIQETVPGILRTAPTVDKKVPVQNDLHSFTWEVDGNYAGAAVDPEDGAGRGPSSHGGRRAAAGARCGHRLGGEDEALLRAVSDWGKDTVEWRELRGGRRADAEDAGGRRQRYQSRRQCSVYDDGRYQGHEIPRRHLDEL